MSKLLINEPPLMVLPSLAKAIGLNESIVLQQLHYWLLTSSHKHDGRKWIYNTYENWQTQFPFWSLSTIRRALSNLRSKSLILTTDKYNKRGFDNTLWFAIDYEALASVQVEQTVCSERTDDVFNLNSAIPETTTKNTSETTTTDANASAQHDVAPPLSAAQVFRNFHDELQNPKANRAAILHRAYGYCYGEENIPDFGRIGTFAKRVGGAGMALTLMWEFLSRPPNGNVLDYLETTFKGRQADRRKPYSRKVKAQAHDSGRKYSEYSTDAEPKRSYSVPADYAYAVAGQKGDG